MARVLLGLLLSFAVLSAGAVFANGVEATASAEPGLVVTGIVTERDGNLVKLRTDDGKDYTINATNATVMLDKLPGNCLSLRVGDRMRVYGFETTPGKIDAERVLIFLSETEASVTKSPEVAPPPAVGAGPAAVVQDDVLISEVGGSLGGWRSRGLVTALDYSDRLITIATSTGIYMIDVGMATIVTNNRTVSRANIRQGDVVRVWGEFSGLNKIAADRVEIVGDRSQQEAALALKNISVGGKISYIHYPSYTFKISTDTGEMRVLVDENTFIHSQRVRKAFMNLAIGQIVKVDAVGNLTSGYVASRVQIVGAPGE